MSADNWAVCPRCLYRAKAEERVAHERVMATYGQVPVEEFDAARAALQTVSEDACCTLREDYEFYGAEEGEVHAVYKCYCAMCGLSGELKASERFWTEADG